MDNPVIVENARTGTTAWELTNPSDNHQIEGYASLTSVLSGQTIDFFVNTTDPTYTVTLYRMGWYGGTGAREVLAPLAGVGVKQQIPTPDASNGFLVECDWIQPTTIPIPAAWLSGIYLAKLHADVSGRESYIIFTVRDQRPADLVFQQSVTTYQAYNSWPAYDANGYGDGLSFYSPEPATLLSFNRPYGGGYLSEMRRGIGAGDFLTHDYYDISVPGSGASAWEYCMLRWLEREGYDVTYITNLDTHDDGSQLLRGRALLSVGHDEYWSPEMRANVVAARDQGVHLAFFSGNYAFWPVDLLPDGHGKPSRSMYCSKDDLSETWAGQGFSEQEIAGGRWADVGIANEDIVVAADAPLDHWVFSGTQLRPGDSIPGLIGYEFQSVDAAVEWPQGLVELLRTDAPDYRVSRWRLDPPGLADCPSGPNQQGLCPDDPFPDPGASKTWSMTIYEAESGARVFNAGTVHWSWGLDDYFTGLASEDGVNNGPAVRTQCGYSFRHPGLISSKSAAVEQMTRNVLGNFIEGRVGEFYAVGGRADLTLTRHYSDWRDSWSLIAPGTFSDSGYTDLLFYDRDAGLGAFYSTDGQGGLVPLAQSARWSKGWSEILSGSFLGRSEGDLLLYDADSGIAQVYATKQLAPHSGHVVPLKSFRDWRRSWTVIVPGGFSDTSSTDLLFYGSRDSR